MASDGLPPLREVIARYGLSAKKQLGQNFLLDLNLTGRIARATGPLAGVTVIEVGPGPGGLTRALLAEGAKKVIAIERDSRVLPALAEISAAYPGRLEVIEADALATDYRALAAESPARIIANLPYNIATPLLTGWLTLEPWPSFFDSLTLMFQREVAERIVARPGDKAFGRLGVLAGWRTDARIAFNVDRAAFTPPPKVTSSVVVLRPKPADNYIRTADLEAVTKAAFGQRRKMVRQSLKGLPVPVPVLLEAAESAGDERAEDLPIEAFLRMASLLSHVQQIAELLPEARSGDYLALDDLIIAAAGARWRKIARIVSDVHAKEPHRCPDELIGARIVVLIETGRLEAQGNPALWRFSEVRLPEN